MEVNWKEYVDIRIHNLEKATETATAEMDRRLEGMNEFRAQLDKQAGHFITRAEHEFVIKELTNKADKSAFENQVKEIESLRLSRAELQGKASQTTVFIGYALTFVVLLVSIWLHFSK